MGIGTLRRNREQQLPPTEETTADAPPAVLVVNFDELDVKGLKDEAERRGIDHKKLRLRTRAALLEVLSDPTKTEGAIAASHQESAEDPGASTEGASTEEEVADTNAGGGNGEGNQE